MSGMDMFSSNEDLVTKTRKPYTITKQRERWTSEEHNRFLEAIKLYGRAWQKIEEHVGTKTAVQIRSHAQKFFSKLEKEAHIKGASIGQARDIDIPPPRPKRKPCNPYPRKTIAGSINSTPVGVKDGNLLKSASSSHSNIQIQDLHEEKPSKRTRDKESFEVNNSSGILTLSQETPCTSCTPSIKSPPVFEALRKKCLLKSFVPSMQESNKGCTDECFMNSDAEENQKLDTTDSNYTDLDEGLSGSPKLNTRCHSVNEEPAKGEKLKQSENLSLFSKEEIQCNQNYPRHIPVQVLESSSEACTQSASHGMTHTASIIHQVEGTCGKANNFTSPTASATTENRSSISIQHSSPRFPSPLNPLSNDQVNTTFSNLIVSTLLQNPAAHAAASFTASLWPFTSVENTVGSPSGTIEGFQLRHGGPSPSASAIAAATVMAASAWWAAHGLLPFCPPLHGGFTCISAPVNPSPTDASLLLVEKENNNDGPNSSPLDCQQVGPGFSDAPEEKYSDGDLPLTRFSDCDKIVSSNLDNAELDAPVQEQKHVSVTGFQESDKGKSKELVDRSSCGSNTPSSSEVDLDILEKGANGKDESKDHRTSEPINHRFRNMGNMTESWREVSEEGKLAFKALFSREVLPQSFSPPKSVGDNVQLMRSDEEGMHKADESGEGKLQIDLNSNILLTCLDCRETENGELLSRDGVDKGMPLMGCGNGKLKSRRTGFKPYKRCSVEVKEVRGMQESEKGEEREPKRVCLQGEAST